MYDISSLRVNDLILLRVAFRGLCYFTEIFDNETFFLLLVSKMIIVRKQCYH